MITSVKKGGLFGIALACILLVAVSFIPVYESLHLDWNTGYINIQWVERSFLLLFVIIQAIWFQRVIHNARFFEYWSLWPWFVFMSLVFLTPGQLTSLNVFIPNFIWLIFYQKLFYHQEREMTNNRIFMDAGVLFCIACLFHPPSIFMFPFLLILLNQFEATNLNRFYLVVLSFIVTALSVLVIGWVFVDEHWIGRIVQNLKPTLDITVLKQPATLYSYIAVVVVLFALVPVVYNRLAFMQTQNRTVINVLYLQVFFALASSILSGKNFEQSLVLVGLPASFIISFGSYHLKSRWLTNIFLICFVFALILIQWTYMRNALKM